MNNNDKPIGVFDSGLGGISVLKELYALMPNENFLYYGDSKNAPYGTKTDEEIEILTKNAVDFLIQNGAKAVVIACNTATSVAANVVRNEQCVPVIGIEPAIKPAALEHNGEKIIVMATPVTLKREKFLELMKSYEKYAEIVPLPCPGLAELIEEITENENVIEEYVRNIFRPYRSEKIGAIVLGCTHYPHIKKIIQKTFEYDVAIYDGGLGTAKETKRRLSEIGALNATENKGVIDFVSSSGDEKKTEIMKEIFEL